MTPTLIYSGKILQDNSTLGSYNIKENGFVVCVNSKPKAVSQPAHVSLAHAEGTARRSGAEPNAESGDGAPQNLFEAAAAAAVGTALDIEQDDIVVAHLFCNSAEFQMLRQIVEEYPETMEPVLQETIESVLREIVCDMPQLRPVIAQLSVWATAGSDFRHSSPSSGSTLDSPDSPWQGISWRVADPVDAVEWYVDGEFTKSEQRMERVVYETEREISLLTDRYGDQEDARILVSGTVLDVVTAISQFYRTSFEIDGKDRWVYSFFFEGILLDGTVMFGT